MSRYIDVVTGFFQSGKTTFINSYVESEVSKVYDRILIISSEIGMENYDKIKSCKTEIFVEKIMKKEDFNEDRINELIEKYEPEHIIIEYNGVWEMENVIGINYTYGFNIKNVFTVVDFNTFDTYLNNMESIMVDKISNCDILVFTKSGISEEVFECLDDEDRKKVEDLDMRCSAVSHINSACSIFISEELFKDEKTDFIKKKITNSDKEILKFGGLLGVFYLVIFGIKIFFPSIYTLKVEKGIWIFISLLVQILPFIIIGAIISGIIQVFVPQKKFLKVFEKSSIKSVFMALFLGAFFPVCDCAMVPIATSIAKKGYSVPVTITFLLASPALNPIVILSTYYAFPNMPKMVLYRIGFGLLIAFIMGLILSGIEYYKINLKPGYETVEERKKAYRQNIIKDHIEKYRFSDFGTDKLRFKGKLGYVEAVITHCRQELFKIGPYIIFGAAISAFIQVMIPRSVFTAMNQVNFLAVAMMLLSAFFISICSTSNAFIARSFFNIMPLNAILAFVVMGPILDITNISVMLGTFKKKFVMGLVVGLVYIAFIIFSIMGGGVGIV